MRLALKDADLSPDEVCSISACANSSVDLDRAEARAVGRIWGDEASRIPVSAIKSMLGEFNSCGGLRVVASALSLRHQWIPPTIHYRVPDPDCNLNCVPNTGRAAPLQNILINGSSSGGSHISLILRRSVE